PHSFADFYGSALDTCVSEYTFSGEIVEASDASELVLERVGGDGLTLAWSDESDQFDAELKPPGAAGNAFAYQATYDLATLDSGTKYPAISMPGFAGTPGSFDVHVGSTCLDGYGGLDDTLPPSVCRSQFDLAWTPEGAADFVVVRLDLW